MSVSTADSSADLVGGASGGVATAVAGLACADDAVSDTELGSRLAELTRLRALVDAALVQQVAAFDARAAARHDGQTSTVAWLRSRLRLGGGQAGRLLLVARQLPGLPLLAKALVAGEVSLEHAAEVARLASQVGAGSVTEFESALVELARQAPVVRVRQACQHLRVLLDADGAEVEAAGQQQRRYVSAARTIGGMVHLQGLLDAASGDVVLTALQAAMPVPAEYEPRTAAQRRADALRDICAGWLAAGQAPAAGGMRPQVQVTVSLRSLQTSTRTSVTGSSPGTDRTSSPGTDRTSSPAPDRTSSPAPDGTSSPAPDGTSATMANEAAGELFGRLAGDVPRLADGTYLSPSTARRLACDAGVIPVVLGSDGEVLDLGRQARLVPVGLRRLLHLRDGGCRFAGCDRPASWCDAHHLTPWADGGTTDPDNCVLLCQFHHTLVHQGWRIDGDPHGLLRFHRPDGTRLHLTSTPRGP